MAVNKFKYTITFKIWYQYYTCFTKIISKVSFLSILWNYASNNRVMYSLETTESMIKPSSPIAFVVGSVVESLTIFQFIFRIIRFLSLLVWVLLCYIFSKVISVFSIVEQSNLFKLFRFSSYLWSFPLSHF